MSDQLYLFTIPEHTKDNKKNISGKPRLNRPIRNQVEFINASLDDLLPDDHPARNIWDFINQMNLSSIINKIQSTSCNPGRPATDPKVLFAIWIYAITQGIGSARMIDRYCREHIAFKWLCGGIEMNYHTISDFRKNNAEEFDHLISISIARLMEKNLVTLTRVSQDGMKVRACAGSSSFRRKPKLKELLAIAKDQVDILREELDRDSSICLTRQQAAKKRACEERKQRIEQAVKEHNKLVAEIGQSKKKHRKKFTPEEKEKVRVSITDPESRKMKMANGGFNPAINMQIVIDTKSRFIVGSNVTSKRNDFGELSKMLDQIESRYDKKPKEILVDQGYLLHEDIVKVQKKGCKVYANPKNNAYKPYEGENEELSEWRVRMGLDESKEIYKDRAATSEWANAGMRNRGLKQLLVRGIKKVKGVLCLHVLTHNITRAIKLGYSW